MKICVATGTRAEYGLLRPLLEQIKIQREWHLQLLVTGAHLSPEFGLTYKIIEKDGFIIDAKVEMLLSSDSPEGIVKSMGVGMIGFADALKNLMPAVLVILGDRYEMLALASAALVFRIPIVHIHGGERTEGAYDDSIRHAITKLSHLHFASTEEYRKRIIQLGEQPRSVFNVGAIGLDGVRKMSLLSKGELEADLGIQFKKYNYLVAFHPITLDTVPADDQFGILLRAIDSQNHSFFIFTKSNADTNGRIINMMMNEYVLKNPDKAVVFTSLGNLRFLSVMNICEAIVGNSSSGIIEAPSLHTATINVGDRQKGRIMANSIINTRVNIVEIVDAFEVVKSTGFKKLVANVLNPYEKEETVRKIVEILKSIQLSSFEPKSFFDI